MDILYISVHYTEKYVTNLQSINRVNRAVIAEKFNNTQQDRKVISLDSQSFQAVWHLSYSVNKMTISCLVNKKSNFMFFGRGIRLKPSYKILTTGLSIA